MLSVEPSVPARVRVLLSVNVFPAAIVNVPVPVVMVLPLIEVAVAAPSVGVVSVGLVPNTTAPLPVVPVADAR